MKNKKLIKKYPWLLPRNVWTDKVLEDYDYTYTELDCIPAGWMKAFGMMMVKEYDNELRKYNFQRKYRIVQIKEKFGQLRWYDNGHVGNMGDINSKYETISENICIRCGCEAPMIDTGWMSPYCFQCFRYIYNRRWKGDKTDDELRELYKEFCCEEIREDEKYMRDSFKYTRFSTDGKETVTVDISDTVQKIRNRQKKWIPKKIKYIGE